MRVFSTPSHAALTGVGAQTADATDRVVIPGGCDLGRWHVNITATFIGTYGDPARGRVERVRLTAPGPLRTASFSTYRPNGTHSDEIGLPLSGKVGDRYLYQQVDVYAWTENFFCGDFLHATA